MRKVLLLFPFLCFSFLLMGQSPSSGNTATESIKKIVRIYPNPAFNFIGLNEISNIGSIIIYNLVGRKMKKFKITKGEKYDITDLSRGMYLVQLLDQNGKVVMTQRMSKK